MTEAELLAYLRERYDYDRERGAFYRRVAVPGCPVGSRIGSPSSTGRRQAEIGRRGNRYAVDALVWLVETGSLPGAPLAHLNRDNGDDRFENLALHDRRTQHVDRDALFDTFRKKAIARFGSKHKYDGSTYISANTAMSMSCVEHGAFQRKPEAYLASRGGCPTCSREDAPKPQKKSAEARMQVSRAYRARNARKYNEAAARFFERTKGIPEYAATRACRQALSRVLRDAKRAKEGRTEDLHGYTFEEFRRHIEAQFEPWMTWANHGEWHVDHVVPVAHFLSRGITDVSIINALDNLRPLRASENLSRARPCRHNAHAVPSVRNY